MRQKLEMTAAKYRSALVWLAVAALSIAVTARAQSGAFSSRAYATPVLQFIAAHASEQPAAANAVHRLLSHRNAGADRHDADGSTWSAMLPVFFVGLVAPLNILSTQALDSTGRTPAAPALPASFQRPPPQLL